MSLSVKNLSIARGQRIILENVNFDVAPGTCCILRGPNGCGKTTLLKTIAGILPPKTGETILDREMMAYAGHLDAIKSQLTVKENLTFWARVYGTYSTNELPDELGLAPLADTLGHHLSAGQRRRLGLARLYLTGAKIWLLDEPTNSLDKANAALFAQTLQNHCKAGGLAVISSHVDLGLKDTQTIELQQFKPTGKGPATIDPFLEGHF